MCVYTCVSEQRRILADLGRSICKSNKICERTYLSPVKNLIFKMWFSKMKWWLSSSYFTVEVLPGSPSLPREISNKDKTWRKTLAFLIFWFSTIIIGYAERLYEIYVLLGLYGACISYLWLLVNIKKLERERDAVQWLERSVWTGCIFHRWSQYFLLHILFL